MLVNYLKEIPLFSHLKEAQLKEIAARCRMVRFAKGEVIFHRTDMSTDLYIVDRGGAKAVLSDNEGDEIVLARFEPGSFFGELSLLDGKGRSATIVADTDAELSILSQTDLLGLLSKDPRIAIAMMATLADRLRKADEKIEALAFQAVGERLVRSLIDGADHSEHGLRGFLRSPRRTHRELAGLIGSSREAVSKCLKALAANGAVQETEGYFLVAEDALDRIKQRPQH